ncbi:MFS transporter [Streptomyces sp. 7-21]|uniref:MFS transporter n=1 Tax=Streptomyces sp. 7-21 TaxID=2802283 RepID=UPI00192038F4|nr:MFS transporter [Streptomyces sp. 7-21]MBL1066592.1 MFS transporter [Streptomyces sp. 7-21]
MSKASPTSSPPAERDRLPLAGLLALATAGFLTMLTEAVPAGLLPQLSDSLDVSESQAGQLLTVYAAGSVVAAIPLTALTRGLPRRAVLLATIAVVAAVNLLTAVSSVYALTLVGRVVSGMAAGVQWAMLAGYAMRLVPAHLKGRALAVSMAGVPLALAFGVPVGTFAGSLLGWRYTFATMGLLAVAVTVWILWSIPPFPGEPAASRTPVRKVFALPGIAAILLAAFAFEVGHMNLYTYVASFLERSGLEDHVGPVLLVFGVASMGGLFTAGALIDRNLRAVVLGSLGLFTGCMLVFGTGGTLPVVVVGTMAFWGFTLGIAPTMFQAASARAAGASAEVAQSMVVTVLNAGMSAGAMTGGIALDAAGTASLPWLSFAVFAGALALAVTARRHAFPPPGASAPPADGGQEQSPAAAGEAEERAVTPS